MQARRDQVQAQTYVVGRLVGALVAAESDGLESPQRRTVIGAIAGVLVGALVVVGFAVYGFLVPGGSDSWRKPGVLITEKETGNRYVFDSQNERLFPVLNYTSALLLFDGKIPKTVNVSQKSLRGVAHGPSVGIVGAPDVLPAPGALDGQVWSVCALVARDSAGAVLTATTLTIGQQKGAAGRRFAPDEAIVALVPGGDNYLVWSGRRFKLTRPWLAQVLGFKSAILVEKGWLEALPVGPDLKPVAVPGRGEDGPIVDGRPAKIGELFFVGPAAAPERRFLLQRDGLSELSPVAYAMVAADPETVELYGGGRVEPVELSPAALTRPFSRQPAFLDEKALPQSPLRAVEAPADSAWCARRTTADGGAEVGVELTAGPPAAAAELVQGSAGVTRTSDTADAVAVTPGAGGLVFPGRENQAPGSVLFLLTDSGIKYPIASGAVAQQLGYAVEKARPVPRQLLDMLPTGPLLQSFASS
ncbi:type VII secretion protein EccB [Micromonospora sp. CB01531]|uniref:type VII secretion protein EccB n=1 Tax=Micromonospora sp. CB01531 TaxID=1718947 RepID=UPI00093E4FD4|nr:type VII secretion protein EccB [Micromonospora sp. CB01531]OKI85867.1 hypothetical protein A6A27_40125 [Micromonospora sp. CB01531]